MLPKDAVVENFQYELDQEDAEERNVSLAKEFWVQHREVRDWRVKSQADRTDNYTHQDHALKPPVVVQISCPSAQIARSVREHRVGSGWSKAPKDCHIIMLYHSCLSTAYGAFKNVKSIVVVAGVVVIDVDFA